jgi:alpha-ketoglutarate-dependent taurine dioxygenase
VPPLTPQQLEVIQLINDIANRPDVQLTWSLQPGDLQLLNNHTIFHTRDGWEEHEVRPRGL